MALIVSNEVRLLKSYMDAVKDHWVSLVAIKEWLRQSPPNVSAAREAMAEIQDASRDDYLLLWRAPRNGSVFETWERNLLKGLQ